MDLLIILSESLSKSLRKGIRAGLHLVLPLHHSELQPISRDAGRLQTEKVFECSYRAVTGSEARDPYRTTTRERRGILTRFRFGVYRAVVTSKVLDEGIDVLDTDVGVILSGTGNERVFIYAINNILNLKEFYSEVHSSILRLWCK